MNYILKSISRTPSVDKLQTIIEVFTLVGKKKKKKSFKWCPKGKDTILHVRSETLKVYSLLKGRDSKKTLLVITLGQMNVWFGPCILPTQHALKKFNSGTKACGSLVIFSSLTWGSGESTPVTKIFTSRSMGNETTQHRLCSAQYFTVPILLSAMRFIPWRSCTML